MAAPLEGLYVAKKSKPNSGQTAAAVEVAGAGTPNPNDDDNKDE